jgi:hypothetical protein
LDENERWLKRKAKGSSSQVGIKTMSVRKRTWTTAKGEKKEAWIVDYVDQDGDRHIETFKRKKEADAFHAQVGVDVRAGTYTAPSKSITVKEAAEVRSTVNSSSLRQSMRLLRLPARGTSR